MSIGREIAASLGTALRRVVSRLARVSCLATLAATAAASGPCLAGSQYGILWQNTQTGLFGVWQVSEHGTVYGSYLLSASTNPYTDGLFRCGLPPDDGSGCARTFGFSLTELFPGTGGFDFLSYDVVGGAFSLQSTSFSGFVSTPGRILSAGCGISCANTWKPIATGMFNLLGYRALLWWDARDGLLGEWWIRPDDKRTVVWTWSWPACAGSCAAYGTPVAAADFNGDGITDIVWQNAAGRLTVFLERGDGSFTPVLIPTPAPPGSKLVGLRGVYPGTPFGGWVNFVWYNPATGVLQNWQVDASSGNTRISNVTWVCNGCDAAHWKPVGLVAVN